MPTAHPSPADPTETVVVSPSKANGNVAVPGSKSISNRVLLLAALGDGECKVSGLLHSDDTEVMLIALKKMGVQYSWDDKKEVLTLIGANGKLSLPSSELYMKNAGTATRFLTTAVNLIEQKGTVVVTGNERMKLRPIGDLVTALNETGCNITFKEGKGCPPLAVETTELGWKGGKVVLAANVSSQYVSSVLISAPFAKEPVTLTLDDRGKGICSRPYIDITLDLLKQFGIGVEEGPPHVFKVAKKPFKNPPSWLVEGDASSASYPLALAAITGGTVTVTNCGSASIQGDSDFCKLLGKMGCEVKQTDTTTTVTGPQPPNVLKAIEGDVDMDSMTDLFMTLGAVAAVSNGTTRIVNIANQRVKECNRIEAMVLEFKKCGVECKELETGIEVTGNPQLRQRKTPDNPVYIDPRDDHRLAMSFAVLASAVPGIAIQEKSCVNKTYPSFWDHAQKMGIRVEPYAAPTNKRQKTD